MRRIIAPLLFVIIGVLATIVVLMTNDKPDRLIPDLVLLWSVVVIGSIVSMILTKPKYVPTQAGKAILTALREGNKDGKTLHQYLRDSNFLIKREDTYGEIRELKEKRLIEAGSRLPDEYKITPNGRLMLD